MIAPAGLTRTYMYLCLTSNMLKSLASALVAPHPPEELETSQPDARHLAVLDGVLELVVLQPERAERIEDQRQPEDRQTDEHPVEQHQGLDDAGRVVLVAALHVVAEHPYRAQNVPYYLRRYKQHPDTMECDLLSSAYNFVNYWATIDVSFYRFTSTARKSE